MQLTRYGVVSTGLLTVCHNNGIEIDGIFHVQ